jgi:CarD family transcriptional regulator
MVGASPALRSGAGHDASTLINELEDSVGFKVGDRVVYPHHGAAIIRKREKKERDGKKVDYLVLEMVHGELTLRVPADMAEEVGMRPPISKSDVDDLFELIGKRDVREPANWSRRFKNHQEKMKSGDVYQVAEVVRNLALREQGKGLSTAEKSMLERARGILVSELSFALNVSEEKASDKLDAGLQ